MRRRFVCAALLIAAATPLAAQPIYRYRMPDGRIVYSDKTVPGGRLEETLEPPPAPDPEQARAARERREAQARATEEAARRRLDTLEAASLEIREATLALEQAQRALEEGREVREGERIGTYSGRSRLRDTYWARQAANEFAVEEARRRLEQAHAIRNALR